MSVTIHKTEKARELGARYLLEVQLLNRETGSPAPSVWWETRTQAEAYQMLLSILAVYNADGQPNYVQSAIIETNKGKQVFCRNLSNHFLR